MQMKMFGMRKIPVNLTAASVASSTPVLYQPFLNNYVNICGNWCPSVGQGPAISPSAVSKEEGNTLTKRWIGATNLIQRP
ncbi:hypothetical protein WG66_000900 [Moniliophthora roreri]|nr:hypothetical protein WG66_000900 [Moniliophthora roreri]